MTLHIAEPIIPDRTGNGQIRMQRKILKLLMNFQERLVRCFSRPIDANEPFGTKDYGHHFEQISHQIKGKKIDH